MNHILAVAKKELRAWFLSPIAHIFLGSFLLVALFCFFWVEGFFARNVADVRPLFEWLPVLLTFLVPALGMRLWAEEELGGTLEMLRTLPIPTSRLVLGKFLAGWILIAVALALTLPMPITVAILGDLDLGPVVGGYLATMLVAAAWLAITLCVSASTSNQIIALVVSTAACAALWALDSVAGLFGRSIGELLRSVGAVSHFQSTLRGVLDLRDLLYYGSITGFFLLWNIREVDGRRDGGHDARAAAHEDSRSVLWLVGLNLLVLNVLLAPVYALRIDLTDRNEYSISPVTKNLLAGLDEPLTIRGYFSEKTHPLLAPLVPPLRDMILEYETLGAGKVISEVVDPTTDPTLEKEAQQNYGIESVPFRFADRHAASVVNSYFHVLIRYGDQYEVLDFEDLIEVQFAGEDVSVRLRNLEYDLTRAIQKVAFGFTSLEGIFARLPADATLTAFITKRALPSDLAEVPLRLAKVAEELKTRSGGRLTFEEIDPDEPGSKITRQMLAETYGLRPFSLSPLGDETFYIDFVLQVGDHVERIALPDDPSEAGLKNEIVASLKRAGPGSLKTVGMALGGEPEEPQYPGMPPAGGGPGFSSLRQVLEQTYRVESVDLQTGAVPGDVDVLLVANPKDLGASEQFSIDQYLMRGGSVVVLGGPWTLGPNPFEGISVARGKTGLEDLLARWGVEYEDSIVLDKQAGSFPIPVSRDLGGFTVREIQTLVYPAFVDVRSDGMDTANPALSGLPSVVLHWASPVKLKDPPVDGAASPQAWNLLHSTEDSWTLSEFQAQPDFDRFPELGWSTEGEKRERSLAVARMGPFESFWKGKDPPPPPPGEDGAASQEARRNVVEKSPPQARLVVVGSSAFVSDPVVELTRTISDSYLSNLQLVVNLADWCMEDVELLGIRSRGSFARTLVPTEEPVRRFLEWSNYAFALCAVFVLAWLSLGRRSKTRPVDLDPRPAPSQTKEAA